VVGGHQRNSRRSRQVDEEAVAPLLLEVEMALDVDREPIAEEAVESSDDLARRMRIATIGCRGGRPLRSPPQAKKAFDRGEEIVERNPSPAFSRPFGFGILTSGFRSNGVFRRIPSPEA